MIMSHFSFRCQIIIPDAHNLNGPNGLLQIFYDEIKNSLWRNDMSGDINQFNRVDIDKVELNMNVNLSSELFC